MADLTVPMQALATFNTQAATDLATAKANEATAKTSFEGAVAARVKAESDMLLGKATLAVLNGATAVGADIEKAEASPKTKWYLLGAAAIAAVTIGAIVAKLLHWL